VSAPGAGDSGESPRLAAGRAGCSAGDVHDHEAHDILHATQDTQEIRGQDPGVVNVGTSSVTRSRSCVMPTSCFACHDVMPRVRAAPSNDVGGGAATKVAG